MDIRNKTIILDDAGAYTNLKKIVEVFVWNGIDNNVQVILSCSICQRGITNWKRNY